MNKKVNLFIDLLLHSESINVNGSIYSRLIGFDDHHHGGELTIYKTSQPNLEEPKNKIIIKYADIEKGFLKDSGYFVCKDENDRPIEISADYLMGIARAGDEQFKSIIETFNSCCQDNEAPKTNDLNSIVDDNEENPVSLWAEIHRLRAAIKGPEGYATWQDAAIAERALRMKAEKEQPKTQTWTPVTSLNDIDEGIYWVHHVRRVDEQGRSVEYPNGKTVHTTDMVYITIHSDATAHVEGINDIDHWVSDHNLITHIMRFDMMTPNPPSDYHDDESIFFREIESEMKL